MNSEYTRVFKAFSDENRIKVLKILCQGEECACVLLNELNIKQPTLSHHMKILCESGIVTGRRQGRWMYYKINDQGCKYASELLNRIVDKRMDQIMKICGAVTGILGKIKRLGKSPQPEEEAPASPPCRDCIG